MGKDFEICYKIFITFVTINKSVRNEMKAIHCVIEGIASHKVAGLTSKIEQNETPYIFIMKQIKDIHNNVFINTMEATFYTLLLLFHEFFMFKRTSRTFMFKSFGKKYYSTSTTPVLFCVFFCLFSHFNQTPPLQYTPTTK